MLCFHCQSFDSALYGWDPVPHTILKMIVTRTTPREGGESVSKEVELEVGTVSRLWGTRAHFLYAVDPHNWTSTPPSVARRGREDKKLVFHG